MTKQKSKKKTPATAKKAPSTAKKTPAIAKKTPATAKKAPATAKKASADEKAVADLAAYMQTITEIFEEYLNDFHDLTNITTHLTVTERRRLHSAGVRNYGFIDKAFDIARENPRLMPRNLSVVALNKKLRDLETYRHFMLLVQQWLQIATDLFMIQSNDCYMDALRIYRSLQEQAKSRVSGTIPLFEALRTFFIHRRPGVNEPTEKELERDIKKLLHGKADGRITIENEMPKISEGKRKVIGSVKKGRSVFKEIDEADVVE